MVSTQQDDFDGLCSSRAQRYREEISSAGRRRGRGIRSEERRVGKECIA